MKHYYIALLTMFIVGCSVTPYEQLNLDTTSNFKSPSEGKSGVYVYQWKRGVIGAAFDVDFEIKGHPKVSLNTGEYAYFELAPGSYEYLFAGGLIEQYAPVKFAPGQNYFFRAYLLNASDYAALIRDQEEVDAAKRNILSGRYEHHIAD